MTQTGGNAPISARYVTVACVFVTCLILSNILAVKLLEFHGRVTSARVQHHRPVHGPSC